MPFKVIQGHRDFGTNRKPMYWLILTYYLAPFPSYGWLYVRFSLATRSTLHFNAQAGVISCEYRYKWYTAKTRFSGLHFTRRMYRCIFNHFCVIGPKSHHRIRRNNANFTAITPFKVTDAIFMFAICRRPSVCLSSVCLSVCRLSSVCNVRAPYSADWNFRQCFYAM